MRRDRPALLLGAALVLAAALPARAAAPGPQESIESRLMCYCGCADLTVRVCTCGTAEGIRREIAGRLADGEAPEQVIAAFVARHGEKILSAPTAEGFNLLAWIMPFAVLLVAGTAVTLFVRRHSGPVSPPPGEPVPAAAALTPGERDLLKRVEREIREGR